MSETDGWKDKDAQRETDARERERDGERATEKKTHRQID